MTLTIEDLKSKLAWESPDDILELLDVDIITVLDELDDLIIDAQDKLRDYYDETTDGLDREKEQDES
jgi:hypothetical protein